MLFNSHIFMLLFLPLLLAGWYFLNWKKKFQLALAPPPQIVRSFSAFSSAA